MKGSVGECIILRELQQKPYVKTLSGSLWETKERTLLTITVMTNVRIIEMAVVLNAQYMLGAILSF